MDKKIREIYYSDEYKENKLNKLQTSSARLDKEYGPKGSPSREAFEARAKSFYYAEILKEQRKQQKMTLLDSIKLMASMANITVRYSLLPIETRAS